MTQTSIIVEVFELMKRSAVAKVTAVAALAVLILAGAVGIYYYTLAPASPPSTSVTSNTSSTSQTVTNSSQILQRGPAGGYQSNGQPYGAWADYLGYIPSGYVVAPHYAISNTYPCPAGMNSQQCTQFKASCGNGVCDPNESCATCPIDCGINGQLTCDPYTGRPGAPISVCQVGQIG